MTSKMVWIDFGIFLLSDKNENYNFKLTENTVSIHLSIFSMWNDNHREYKLSFCSIYKYDSNNDLFLVCTRYIIYQMLYNNFITAYPPWTPGFTHSFFGVAHLLRLLCCVFALFVFVLCIQCCQFFLYCPVLDCPFGFLLRLF